MTPTDRLRSVTEQRVDRVAGDVGRIEPGREAVAGVPELVFGAICFGGEPRRFEVSAEELGRLRRIFSGFASTLGSSERTRAFFAGLAWSATHPSPMASSSILPNELNTLRVARSRCDISGPEPLRAGLAHDRAPKCVLLGDLERKP